MTLIGVDTSRPQTNIEVSSLPAQYFKIWGENKKNHKKPVKKAILIA